MTREVKNCIGVLSNPRAGTSLMTVLMVNCFDISQFNPPVHWEDIDDIYSYRINYFDLEDDDYYKYNLINMIRDPRDVLTSKHPSSVSGYLVSPERFIKRKKEIDTVKKIHAVLDVRFEDLIEDCDLQQGRISKFFSLKEVIKFSDFLKNPYNISNKNRYDEMCNEMGGARVPDSSKLGRWEKEPHVSYIENLINNNKEIKDILIELGYIDE